MIDLKTPAKKKKIRALICKGCGLSKTPFFGTGSVNADILFIGDPPTRTELLLQEAFTGAARYFFEEMISNATKTSPAVYYLNGLLCRPASKTGEDRELKVSERLGCLSMITNIVHIINPTIIVLTGKIAKGFTKEYPDALCFNHFEYHELFGGKGSPLYNSELMQLRKRIKEVL